MAAAGPLHHEQIPSGVRRMNKGPGKLEYRAHFYMPDAGGQDRFGQEGDHVPTFSRSVALRFLKGSETVLADRLEGRRPAIMTVRRDAETREVGSDWSVKIDGEPDDFAIKEQPRRSDGRGFLEVLIVGGEPV